MGRWLHILALIIVAAVLANAQCSAACFASDSPAAGHHSACCARHQPSPQRSQSGCQHRHSALRHADWGDAELRTASSVYLRGAGDSPVGSDTATVFTVLPTSAISGSNNNYNYNVLTKRPTLLVLSVLRI